MLQFKREMLKRLQVTFAFPSSFKFNTVPMVTQRMAGHPFSAFVIINIMLMFNSNIGVDANVKCGLTIK